MSPQPRPGPQSSNPIRPEALAPREDTTAPGETDVAELAARFAQKGGGSLTPEMTSELALEVVLNEIVEQACQATNATGAAIALVRGDEMVCRASSGATAPDLGARLDTSSGLTGECCRTRQTQRCADALADARVDIEASARLGVRSVIVMPLLRPTGMVGVFELLSCWPSAFNEREERILGSLAHRAIRGLERAEQVIHAPKAEIRAQEKLQEQLEEKPVIPPVKVAVVEVREEKSDRDSESANRVVKETRQGDSTSGDGQNGNGGNHIRRGGFDFLSFSLGAAVLAATVLLAFTVGRRLEAGKTPARIHHNAPGQSVPAAAQAVSPAPADESSAANANVAPPATTASPDAATHSTAPAPAASSLPPSSSSSSAVPAGGLVVYDGGKEVFRLPPNGPGAAKPTAQNSSSANVLTLSPAEAEARVQSRVEPQYPEDARQKKIQGAVVLAIRVGVDGNVEDLQYVSGPAQLAEAAVNAVKQWRFKPQSLDE